MEKIFPGQNERQITSSIIAFIIGAIIGLSISVDSSELVSGSITLMAAFIGAYFAFKLNDRKREQLRIERNVDSGNKAIFNLIRIYNAFGGYKETHIEPHLKNPLRYIGIRPSIGFEHSMENFDFDSLIYLVTADNPGLIGEISELQIDVLTTFEIIKKRNEIHYEEIQKKISDMGIKPEEEITEQVINRSLEIRTIESMKSLTDAMIDSVDSILEKTRYLIDTMGKLHSHLYPDYPIIGMKYVSKETGKQEG
ncbi:hypothetical protein [Saccharospirillum alexandrii]|uniref:hypothetical protein n=1 Tax=Saccharospirillum alexandrii TaxID=2448477 RepID=UPI003734DF6E